MEEREPDDLTSALVDNAEAEALNDPIENDSERFFCPFPSCNRSFAELWRLKVHYRAPPDVRGSGRERGHGTELAFCPRCEKPLKPGKHHVGCIAGKSSSKPSTKRRKKEGPKEADKVVELLPLMNPTSTHMLEPQHLLQNQQWQQQQQQQVLMAGGPPGSSKGMAWMALDPMLAQVAHGPFYYPVPMMWPDPASFQMHLAQYQMTQTVPPQMAMAVQPQLGIAVPVPGQPTPILPTLMPQNAPLASASNPDLSRVFDDVDENRYSVPSPPPLPEDFAFPPPPPPNDAHSTNGGGGGGGMLFNFGQFSHRMSRSQPVLAGTSKLVNELSQEAMDLAEANVVYETHDDGDLMQMLFGVADEMPTMATIHIHKFPSPPLDLGGEAEENGAVAAADSGSASVAGDFCPLSGSSEHGGQEAEGVKRRTSDVEAMHHEQNHDQRSHAGVTVGGMSGTGVCGHRLSSTDQETQQQQQHVAGCSGERGKLGGCLDAAAAAATQGGELWNGLRGVPTANGHEGYDSSFRLVLPTN